MLPPVTSIARRFLCEKLAECNIAPLEPSARSFLEGRFGAHFDDVRIHTGTAASGLCLALGARVLQLVFIRLEGVTRAYAGTYQGENIWVR